MANTRLASALGGAAFTTGCASPAVDRFTSGKASATALIVIGVGPEGEKSCLDAMGPSTIGALESNLLSSGGLLASVSRLGLCIALPCTSTCRSPSSSE